MMAALNLRYLLLSKVSVGFGKWYNELESKGEYHLLVKELGLQDAEYFFQCFRVSSQCSSNFSVW